MTKPGYKYTAGQRETARAAQRKRRSQERENGGPISQFGRHRRWPQDNAVSILLEKAGGRFDAIQLTQNDFARMRERLKHGGLSSIAKIAAIVGVCPRQLARYAAGELPIDGPLARLLVVLDMDTSAALRALALRAAPNRAGANNVPTFDAPVFYWGK